MNELDQILETFPFDETRTKKIADLTKSNDFRALLINQLIVTIDQNIDPQFIQEKSIQILSEAKAIVRMLKITLKTKTIKE